MRRQDTRGWWRCSPRVGERDLAKLREAGLGTPSGSLRGSMSMRGSQTSVVEGVMQVDRDLTDWEDRGFRYSL